MELQSNNIIPIFEKIEGIKWVRAFHENGKELEITWISRNGIGFKRIKEERFTVFLMIEIQNCTPKERKLKIDVSLIGEDESGFEFHIDNDYGAELDLGYLLHLSKIKNQSEELTINQILEDKGINEWGNKVQRKKIRFRIPSSIGQILGILLAILIVTVFNITTSKSENGAIATNVYTEEISTKNGVTIEKILPEGTKVRAKQTIAVRVNPKLLGELTNQQAKIEDAKARKMTIKNDIATKTILIKNQTQILKNSQETLDGYKKLAGFMRKLDTNRIEQQVYEQKSEIEILNQEVKALKLELEAITKKWGENFQIPDAQIIALRNQIKEFDVKSKCECVIQSVEQTADLVTMKLVDLNQPAYIEASVKKEKAVNLKIGQPIQFMLQGGDEYLEGTYSGVQTNTKQRIGLQADSFNNSKFTVIRIIPNDPIPVSLNDIGKPVSVLLTPNMFTKIKANIKGAIHSLLNW